jgi:hypothetical protein
MSPPAQHRPNGYDEVDLLLGGHDITGGPG